MDAIKDEAAAHNSSKKRKRRRKTKERERKLLVGTKVEVLHFDEGLKGSWHPGVVIACEKLIRFVEYINLLDDDGSSKLKERISVSPAVEGRLAARRIWKNYRGRIRPLFSNSSIQESTLSYGLCVDAFVNEAWWEGVVFDREEGSKERVVFFPDQGDQDKFDVNHLRVTQDWDEVSGDWKPRGDWLFVRMLEKHEGFLPVSVRQIWYDVRSCDDFRCNNLEWMHEEKSLWDRLVSEAVQENMHAACGEQAITAVDSVFAEGLPVRSSKRRKTSKSHFSMSERVSGDTMVLQSSDACVDKDNQVIQPILTFPSELSAAAPVTAPDVGLEEDGDFKTHDYACDEVLSTCRKGLPSLCSDSGFVFPKSAVNFSVRNGTFQTLNGCLTSGCPKGTDLHFEEGASTCHQALPFDPDSGSLKLARNLDLESFDLRLDDPCLATEMPVAVNDSQYDGLSTCALPCFLQNEMVVSDIQTKCMLQEQSLSEFIGNSCAEDGAGTVHPFGGEDDDLEAIVLNNGGKTDLICADHSAEPDINPACWEGESHEALGQEEAWKALGKDFLPVAACSVLSKKRCEKETIKKVRMQLLFLGWKIKSIKWKHQQQTFYVSPDGNTYNSLREVFVYLGKPKREVRIPRNGQGCVGDKTDVVCDDHGVDFIINPVCGDNEEPWKALGKDFLPGAAYSQAIRNYYACAVLSKRCDKDTIKKVRMQLLLLGWKIKSRKCKRQQHTFYVSPDGNTYDSLREIFVYFGKPKREVRIPRNGQLCVGDKNDVVCDDQGVDSISNPACGDNVHKALRTNESWKPLQKESLPKAKCSPLAMNKYCAFAARKNLNNNMSRQGSAKEAKMHLLFMGWKFEYKDFIKKKDGIMKKCVRIRYVSPDNKRYESLHQACLSMMRKQEKYWISTNGCKIVGKKLVRKIDAPSVESFNPEAISIAEEQVDAQGNCSPSFFKNQVVNVTRGVLPAVHLSDVVYFKAEHCPQAVKDYLNCYLGNMKDDLKENIIQLRSKAKMHLLADGWSFCYKPKRVGVKVKRELHYKSPNGKCFGSLRTACEAWVKDDIASKKGKSQVRNGMESIDLVDTATSTEFEGYKQLLHGRSGFGSTWTIQTVLSWLIDNDVVLPRQKVCYRNKKNHHVMAEGQITREGIKCKCCKKVYNLSHFEVHAGGTDHRPAANIFLEDGRSLLQCQMQIVNGSKFKGLRLDTHQRMKGDYSRCESDNICSICHYGGDLILCDYCPSSFHISCIGLKDVPDGKWSCSSCRCGICGESEFNADIEQFTAQTILYCDQCEREFHVGCLRKRGPFRLQNCPQGNWFCSKKCSKTFGCLQKLLGKSKPTAVKGLSWTILRSKNASGSDLYSSDVEATTEHHSKLCVAASVLHECFVPLIEPRTKSDLVTDVLFNKRSELKRLNFRGFYTMLLKRGDELISVAAIRIHGEKVAEIPLVGTRVQYRRQGMCRLLLNELEKMLSNLRVEWLLLPAAPQLLETWTTSFGFTKMTSSDRLQFLEHTFVNFQDTTMCLKLLMPSTTKATESGGTEVGDKFGRSNEKMDSDGYNTIPELLQTGEPVITLPSVDGQGYLLHGEVGMGKETSAHSSSSGDHGSGPMPFIQEVEEIELRETANPVPMERNK